MLMDLGIGQYLPNQGKESKQPACYGWGEVGNFKRDCLKRSKGIV